MHGNCRSDRSLSCTYLTTIKCSFAIISRLHDAVAWSVAFWKKKNVRVQCCTAWIRLDARRWWGKKHTHISNKCDMLTFINPNACHTHPVDSKFIVAVRNSHFTSSANLNSALPFSHQPYKTGWKCNFDASSKNQKKKMVNINSKKWVDELPMTQLMFISCVCVCVQFGL